MVDHPEEKEDSDGDEEELKDRMHSSSFTSNLSEELFSIFTGSERYVCEKWRQQFLYVQYEFVDEPLVLDARSLKSRG